MLVPLSWLKEYVDLTLPTADLAERLTLAGLEVATVHQLGDWWDPETVLVGQVVAVAPHPDADRLVLVDIDYGGNEPERVVTGAPNLFDFRDAPDSELPVLKVAFARAGAMLVDAYSDEEPRPLKKLKAGKIRGIKSAGMVCSERELGISEEHGGILLLPNDAPTGASLRSYLGDEIIELELTPDMARCLNLIGVAREVAALTGAALHLPADEVDTGGDDDTHDYADAQIDDPGLCPRFTLHLIRDVEIGPSPKWMQERLIKAGMRPISNIVDITNYVMLEWGQPLHAFDYDVLVERAKQAGKETPVITVKTAGAGEKFTTLDDKARTLSDSMLMITDDAGSLAIAGVMGGQESEVGPQTRNVLLEAASFNGINNRRTAMALRIPSAASHRFARGIPPQLNPLGARRAAELMRQHAGGRVVPGLVDAYPAPQPPRVLYTTASDTRRLLGLDLSLDEIAGALRQLDFAVEQVDEIAAGKNGVADADATFALKRETDERGNQEPLLACTAPWYRLDMRYPADLTEEVARMVGYDRIGTTLIDDVLPPQRRSPLLETEGRIREVLVGLGLQETVNYPLTTVENHLKLVAGGSQGEGKDVGQASGGADFADAEGFITLVNPVTPERQHMRRSLLVSALENLARNLRFADRLAAFEVGRIYLPEEKSQTNIDALPLEERHLSLVLTGPRRQPDFHTNGSGSSENVFDFFDLKGVAETLLARLGFDANELEFRAKPNTSTFGPRCAELLLDGKVVGLLGELHPNVRSAFGLPDGRVCVADLRIEPLVRPDWRVSPMQPISDYPPVIEDLAFVVDEAVTAAAVRAAIADAGGELLTNVELFDIYRGEPLSPATKSMAHRLTYQSTERSLSEKEITKLRQRIIRSVEKAVDGQLRG